LTLPPRWYKLSERDRDIGPCTYLPVPDPGAHFRALSSNLCREAHMAWIKPQFKVVALCMEITTYSHNR
jgi:hypothetical protein